MTNKKNKCKKCYYGTHYSGMGEQYGCQYILLTGRARECEFGDNCVVYKPKDKEIRKHIKIHKG